MALAQPSPLKNLTVRPFAKLDQILLSPEKLDMILRLFTMHCQNVFFASREQIRLIKKIG